MFTDKRQIQEALLRTGRRLALLDAGEFALLVCGGSALNLGGLLERPTRDVDVLGLVKGAEPATVQAEPLPPAVAQAAEWVAQDLGLPSDWLNDAAMDVQRLGLPQGILNRARRLEFGPCLTVFVIGRRDQVALKLYAAIDREKGRRHLQDLETIAPTRAEIQFAVCWLLDRQTSEQFRAAVQSIAEGFGFMKLRAFERVESPVKQARKKTSRGRRKDCSRRG